jgi:hypothetical protein
MMSSLTLGEELAKLFQPPPPQPAHGGNAAHRGGVV